jgi:hypothetical protein
MSEEALSRLHDLKIDARLIETIERATHKDPIYRFKTARHFHRALTDLSDKRVDEAAVLARLIARIRAPAETVSGSGGVGGKGSGNYFETIAALAAKKHQKDSSATTPGGKSPPLPARAQAPAPQVQVFVALPPQPPTTRVDQEIQTTTREPNDPARPTWVKRARSSLQFLKNLVKPRH